MEQKGYYNLAQVIAVAKVHPFYNTTAKYPPDLDTIELIQKSTSTQNGGDHIDITKQPLVTKKSLYRVIERLLDDTSEQNTYRHSAYISVTGGGSGGRPLLFATDTMENRRQRAMFGKFLKMCRVVEPRDWVLCMHSSGYLYRSLDLISELLENAGASVLSGGHSMTPPEIIKTIICYNVNVITGDGSQVVQTVHHIARLPTEQRQRITLTKVIYTSESLTDAQLRYIEHVLGHGTKIFSILGSAEAGPYGVNSPDLIDEKTRIPGTMDFIFDTRMIHNEVLHPSMLNLEEKDQEEEEDNHSTSACRDDQHHQQAGIIVQTSLQRLRNPLVRYVTGDKGSIHPLSALTSEQFPEPERKYLRILRLHGRDTRFSFEWYGDYFEFNNVVALMQNEEWGILQWQLILDYLGSSLEVALEVRILCAEQQQDHRVGERGSREAIVQRLEKFFLFRAENKHLFRITFLEDLKGFVKSSTGNKVIKFVDRVH